MAKSTPDQPQPTLTDAEIVVLANELARLFYSDEGYVVPEGYRFDRANRHPHQRACWRKAVIAFELLRQTDVEDALANMEEGCARAM